MGQDAQNSRQRTPRQPGRGPAAPAVNPRAGVEIVLNANAATNLTSSAQIFERSFAFLEFKKLTGLVFKNPMASKDETKNCFILAKYPDSEEVDFVIPCGPSVEAGDALEELEFGEILNDDNELFWLAYRPSEAGGGAWQ